MNFLVVRMYFSSLSSNHLNVDFEFQCNNKDLPNIWPGLIKDTERVLDKD